MSRRVPIGSPVAGCGRWRGFEGRVTGHVPYPYDRPVRYMIQWGLTASVECERHEFRVRRKKR